MVGPGHRTKPSIRLRSSKSRRLPRTPGSSRSARPASDEPRRTPAAMVVTTQIPSRWIDRPHGPSHSDSHRWGCGDSARACSEPTLTSDARPDQILPQKAPPCQVLCLTSVPPQLGPTVFWEQSGASNAPPDCPDCSYGASRCAAGSRTCSALLHARWPRCGYRPRAPTSNFDRTSGERNERQVLVGRAT